MKILGDTFMPSLRDIAFTKISIALWSQQEVKTFVSKFVPSRDLHRYAVRTAWELLVAEVAKNAKALPMPNCLREELFRFIQAVGWRTVVWFHSYKIFNGDDSEIPDKFCWTSLGTIDNKETAKLLVQNQNLHLESRYALACTYCLEEYIYSLGDTFDCKTLNCETGLWDTRVLMFLWSDYRQGVLPQSNRWADVTRELELTSNSTFPEFGLKIASYTGNVEAIKFFLQKVPAEEKGSKLVESASIVVKRDILEYGNPYWDAHTDALCYLLSVMNENEQMQVFEYWKAGALYLLLNWPWRELFVKAVECLKGSISDHCYYKLFNMIIERVKWGNQDYNYLKLFRKYWQEVSAECKSYYIHRSIEKRNFINFLTSVDTSLVALVLEDASVAQKEKMIFDFDILNVCTQLILINEWNLLEFFLLECFRTMDVSYDKIMEFNHQLEQFYAGHHHYFRISQSDWSNFRKFLNELILQKYNSLPSNEENM